MKVLTPHLSRKMSNFAQCGKQGFEKLKKIGCKLERRSMPQIGIAIRLENSTKKKLRRIAIFSDRERIEAKRDLPL